VQWVFHKAPRSLSLPLAQEQARGWHSGELQPLTWSGAVSSEVSEHRDVSGVSRHLTKCCASSFAKLQPDSEDPAELGGLQHDGIKSQQPTCTAEGENQNDPVNVTCGKQTPQSVRLYSRDVYSAPGSTGVAPPKSLRAEQQLVSSTYTTKYYICIRFTNTPKHMHNLSPLPIQTSSKGSFPWTPPNCA